MRHPSHTAEINRAQGCRCWPVRKSRPKHAKGRAAGCAAAPVSLIGVAPAAAALKEQPQDPGLLLPMLALAALRLSRSSLLCDNPARAPLKACLRLSLGRCTSGMGPPGMPLSPTSAWQVPLHVSNLVGFLL